MVRLGLSWISCHRVWQAPADAMPFKSYIIPSCVRTSGSADRFWATAVTVGMLSGAAVATAVELGSREVVMVALASTLA